jgi:uncharacterized cupredoxin-like copper-binding protein
MLLFGLSSGNKTAIIVMAAIFVGFALLCALLIPRWRPQFPVRLWLFVGICVLLFLGMMTTVIVFGKESKAAGEEKTTSTAQTPTSAATTTTAAPSEQTVKVTELEWKVVPAKTTLAAGKYAFDVSNQGKFPHDLTINGPGVSNERTSQIPAGGSAKLSVTLKSGTYDFYCSIPGHKAAGMDQKVTVS